MNSSLLFKDATMKDYNFCHDLAKENMLDLVVKHWGSWNSEIYKKSFDPSRTKLIIYNNKKIGFFRTKTENNILYIEDLQLLPSIKGKGLGTKTVKLIEDKAKKNNIKIIQLSVFKDNLAFNFYKKLDYKIKEDIKHSYIMEKKLN